MWCSSFTGEFVGPINDSGAGVSSIRPLVVHGHGHFIGMASSRSVDLEKRHPPRRCTHRCRVMIQSGAGGSADQSLITKRRELRVPPWLDCSSLRVLDPVGAKKLPATTATALHGYATVAGSTPMAVMCVTDALTATGVQ